MPNRLILTKRHPPEMVGLEGQIIGTSVVLSLVGLFQIWYAIWHVSKFALVSSGVLALNVAVLIFVIWAMSKFSSVIKVLAFGDIYQLDRFANKLVRNGKTLASLNDINCVELKTTGASKVTNTVRIVLNSGRRIFVETGRPEDVSGLASSIAQFAGAQVVGA